MIRPQCGRFFEQYEVSGHVLVPWLVSHHVNMTSPVQTRCKTKIATRTSSLSIYLCQHSVINLTSMETLTKRHRCHA